MTDPTPLLTRDKKMKLQAFALDALDDVVALLRTIDHPKRLEMLIRLLHGNNRTFQDLFEDVGIPKSALGNHLGVLLERGLVDRVDKGIYQITSDGEDLVVRIVQSYYESKVREQERLLVLLRRFSPPQQPQHEEPPMEPATNQLIKVVNLPRTRVVSFHVTDSLTPENECATLRDRWAHPLGLYDHPEKHQVYGFNNPCPENYPHTPYGYEQWVTIPDDFEVDPAEDLTVKEFSGGLYVVTMCKGVKNMGKAYNELVQWVKNNERYRPRNAHELERLLNPTTPSEDEAVFEIHLAITE